MFVFGIQSCGHKVEMKVKMLAVLALVLLVFSTSEGRIFTRCELRSALINATTNATVPANTTANLTRIAQFVCSAERLSRLNTNLVTPIRGRPGRRPRDASDSDSSEENTIIATMFGIFQLSNRVACTSGSIPSLNLCNISCNALIDNNISDDITCLTTLLNITSNAFSRITLLPISVEMLVKECHISPDYFADCLIQTEQTLDYTHNSLMLSVANIFD
ncbi:lysozyme milk isozyme-like protein [Labeo rohita]|uniref:lysozyme n=1 Tax=Labeo rohita TaxID=84645 RepID=A0A498LM09_LABRO|nr:lysozyme milk isozyme-like protein [Labeo rohita]